MCFTNTTQMNAPASHHLISRARKKREQIADRTCNGDLITAYNCVFLMIPVKKTALSVKLQAYGSQHRIQKKNAAPTSIVMRNISPQLKQHNPQNSQLRYKTGHHWPQKSSLGVSGGGTLAFRNMSSMPTVVGLWDPDKTW